MPQKLDVRKIGWAVIVLIALVMGAYALNRGLFIGSNIIRFDGEKYLARECRYLFPSGVTRVRKGGWHKLEEAENEYCPLFRN